MIFRQNLNSNFFGLEIVKAQTFDLVDVRTHIFAKSLGIEISFCR